MSNAKLLREPTVTGTIDMKLEVVVIPVSDVNRAKRFYGDLTLRAQVPNLDETAFARTASDAEKNCPVSGASIRWQIASPIC
jgi:organic hydroperoxide reductase OsmC/OhrA